jgi:hypothetical protein
MFKTNWSIIYHNFEFVHKKPKHDGYMQLELFII